MPFDKKFIAIDYGIFEDKNFFRLRERITFEQAFESFLRSLRDAQIRFGIEHKKRQLKSRLGETEIKKLILAQKNLRLNIWLDARIKRYEGQIFSYLKKHQPDFEARIQNFVRPPMHHRKPIGGLLSELDKKKPKWRPRPRRA